MYNVEMQLTLGPVFDLPPAVRPMGGLAFRPTLADGEYADCEGNIHFTEESRDAADADFVERTFNAIAEGGIEYHTSGDGLDSYYGLVFEDRKAWIGRIEEWIKEYYADRAGVMRCAGRIARMVASDLDDCETQYNGSDYMGYTGTGCCLGSFELGEPEGSVNVSDIAEFAELHGEGRLEALLADYNGEACISNWRGLISHSGDISYSVYPGGRVDCVVPYDTMREAVTTAIIGICEGRQEKLGRRRY